jgi:hypothetical protein
MAPNDIALPDAQLHLKKLASPLAGLEENVEFELRMIVPQKMDHLLVKDSIPLINPRLITHLNKHSIITIMDITSTQR